MTAPERWRLRATALSTALLLAACGGGGGSGPSNATPAAPGAATPAALQNQPGAPTLTNNIAADGLAWINYRRSQLGVPLLVRNAIIDRAAQSHSDYQRVNNVVTHEEVSTNAGYTGVRTQDRMRAAGYVFGSGGYAGEVISATTSSSGFYMAEELITAIYHRFAIFEPKFSEVGTGSATNGANYTYFTANFAAPNGFTAGLGRGMLAHWPAASQTLVPTSFLSDNETPDPVPNANEVGYPVSVHADVGAVITVTSFTLRARGSNADLAAKLLSPGGDEHTARSVAAIVPLAPLRAATTYDAHFLGSVDGAAVDRSWAFTTR